MVNIEHRLTKDNISDSFNLILLFILKINYSDPQTATILLGISVQNFQFKTV